MIVYLRPFFISPEKINDLQVMSIVGSSHIVNKMQHIPVRCDKWGWLIDLYSGNADKT